MNPVSKSRLTDCPSSHVSDLSRYMRLYDNLTCHGQAPGLAFTPPITKVDNITWPQFPPNGDEVDVGMGTKNLKQNLEIIYGKNYGCTLL